MTACFSCHWHRVLQHFGSGMRRNQNFEFLDEEVTHVFRLFDFLTELFFRLYFFSFPFLLAAVTDLLLGLLAVKKTSKKTSSRQALFTMSRVKCRKFCFEFFTRLFEHFCAYLTLHQADCSDLGIIGTVFLSCRS